MNSDIDMNLANYSLTDLLELFHLDYEFNLAELKQAKRMVLMTHPDKAPQLSKDYFLFFSAAYKVILSIYTFRNKANTSAPLKKPEYSSQTIDNEEQEKERIIEQIKVQPNFNKVFNELFEQHKIQDEEQSGGYGDWLKSDEGLDTRTTTFANMGETFEIKKNEIRALVPLRELEEGGSGQGSSFFGANLSGDKPEYYSSDLFSALKYDDVRKAHTETVVPVSKDDYLQRPKFKTVDEMRRDPEYNNTKPLSYDQSKAYLNQRSEMTSKQDVSRAFNLAKQDEAMKKANVGFMSGFRQLTGGQ
jgi:hypothetical protein